MWASRSVDICHEIAEIVEEMLGWSLPIIDLFTLTLAHVGIGQDPIGQGEFLEFQDRLEKRFGIKFTSDEIPKDPISAGKLTLGEISELIDKKLPWK